MNIKHLLSLTPKQLALLIVLKSKVLKYINLQVKAEFADKKYIIPLVNNVGFRNLKYNTEPWMKYLIKKILKSKKGIFLDVGANIGQTLMKVRSVSSMPYIGIEPNPECVIYLQRLIKVNKLKDCTICPIGLSNRNNLLTLYSNFEGSPYATVVEGYNTGWDINRTQIVPVFRGDDLIPNIFPVKEIAIVKIDVEGGELEVFEGMERILNDYRPYVITEIVPIKNMDEPNSASRQMRIERLFDFLKNNNYLIFRVNEKEMNQYEQIYQIEMGKGISDNYVLVPIERENEFLESYQTTENLVS